MQFGIRRVTAVLQKKLDIRRMMTVLQEKLGFRVHLRRIPRALKKLDGRVFFREIGFLLAKLVLYGHGALVALILFFCLLYSVVNPPVTPLMFYRKLHNGYSMKRGEYHALPRIPAKLQNMVVKIEDYKFYEHPGIDFEALLNAYQQNRRIGRIRYGGSTLTMQLARTVFLLPNQTYLRKYFEVLIALEMDLVMKKNRILELYLNYCEWGRGVYGVDAAARYYYRKKVKNLSTDECRRLVTILASPLRYDVNNFFSRRSMVRRYEYLLARFP
jgi:monofunctional biosynthetic peptidoglycan transglycosylase